MKDLDFDELDRAVNSLMKDVSKNSTSPRNGEETTLTIPDSHIHESNASTRESIPAPTFVQPVSSEKKTERPVPVRSLLPRPTRMVDVSPAVAPKRGRFMDVVHPSSEMKKSASLPRYISRQGATIEPGSRDAHPVSSQTSIDTNRDEHKVPAEQEQTVHSSALSSSASMTDPTEEKKSDWPDPLDMVQPVLREEPTPLTTPFLPDTKVEKRPLGGIPSAPSSLEDESLHKDGEKPVVSDGTSVSDSQLPATLPSETDLVLPEELQGAVMAAEADTHMGIPKTDGGAAVVEPTNVEHLPKQPLLKSPEKEPLLEAGASSIPQQYHEVASTGEQGNGAIFDTNTYHQPLAHPIKKRSGWLWVIWIILILLIGAGAGAALYFAGIV